MVAIESVVLGEMGGNHYRIVLHGKVAWSHVAILQKKIRGERPAMTIHKRYALGSNYCLQD